MNDDITEQEHLDLILKEIEDEKSKLTRWQKFKKKFWYVCDVIGIAGSWGI